MARKEQSALIPPEATICDLSMDKRAAKSLERVKDRYPHALTENAWRLGKKVCVLAKCLLPGCDGQRFLATSDLWQVKDCGSSDHSRGPEATRKAVRARVSLKKPSRAVRKARSPRRGSSRARKARAETQAASAE